MRHRWPSNCTDPQPPPTLLRGDETNLGRPADGTRWVTDLGGVFFTDLLVRGFSNAIPGLRQLRGLALTALDALPPVKSFVMRRMIFGAKG